ncbi:MAG: hypothetical protein RJA80_705, partial [Actinomycetota bacterium]
MASIFRTTYFPASDSVSLTTPFGFICKYNGTNGEPENINGSSIDGDFMYLINNAGSIASTDVRIANILFNNNFYA